MARKKRSLLSKEAKDAMRSAKYAERQAKQIYKAQIKEMRPYLKKLRGIDLRKNLSASQKGYVTKAWGEYQDLTLRPTKVFRTKNKKKLKTVQEFSRHSGQVKFDVAFIPTSHKNARIKIKGDHLVISSKYVDEIPIFFNMRAMATDPKTEIDRLIAKYPECKQFVLQAGEYLWNGGISAGLFADKVIPLLERYSPGGAGYEKRGPNSHYTNWALGMNGYIAHNQKDIADYLKEYHSVNAGNKKRRASERRKRARKYGTKY